MSDAVPFFLRWATTQGSILFEVEWFIFLRYLGYADISGVMNVTYCDKDTSWFSGLAHGRNLRCKLQIGLVPTLSGIYRTTHLSTHIVSWRIPQYTDRALHRQGFQLFQCGFRCMICRQ